MFSPSVDEIHGKTVHVRSQEDKKWDSQIQLGAKEFGQGAIKKP